MTALSQADAGARKDLEIDRVVDGPVTSLRFKGTLNERFDGQKIGESLKSDSLILDLGGIIRISSYGIREWKAFLTAAEKRTRKIYFLDCSPRVVHQVNIVRDFVRSALVVSIRAPYHCDACGKSKEQMLSVDRDREALEKLTPPQVSCDCGATMRFDEEPSTFFSYVSRQGRFDLDPAVLGFLGARGDARAPGLSRKAEVHKHVDDAGTYLRISGQLEADFPAERHAEGLEGVVVLDLVGVGGLGPPGAAQLRKLLSAAGQTVETMLIVGCPFGLLGHALQPEDLGKNVFMVSLTLPYKCERCLSQQSFLLEIEEHQAVLKAGIPPRPSCRECGGETTCTASTTLIANIAAMAVPNLDAKVKKFIKKSQALKFEPKKERAARPAAAAAPYLVWIAAALLAVLALIAGLLYMQQRKGEQLAQAVASLKAVSKSRPMWITSDTPATAYCVELAGRTSCVGVSSFVDSKEDGRSEAWDSSLEALGNTVGLKIDDPVFAKMVRRSYVDARQKALTEAQGALHDGSGPQAASAMRTVRSIRGRIASAIAETGGSAVPTQIAEWYWEAYEKRDAPGSAEYLIFVRIDVNADEVRSLAARYARPTEGPGASLLTGFPLFAWRSPDLGEGALVAEIKPGLLADVGLGAGDVVIAVRGKPTKDAEDFVAQIQEEVATKDQHGGRIALTAIKSDGTKIEFDRALPPR